MALDEKQDIPLVVELGRMQKIEKAELDKEHGNSIAVEGNLLLAREKLIEEARRALPTGTPFEIRGALYGLAHDHRVAWYFSPAFVASDFESLGLGDRDFEENRVLGYSFGGRYIA